MEIASEQPVESFLIGLDHSWVRDANRYLSEPVSVMIDDAERKGDEHGFFVKLYASHNPSGVLFSGIRRAVRSRAFEDGWLEESVRGLIEKSLSSQRDIRTSIAGLSAARRSTCEELFRRLARGRDILDAHITDEIPLNRVAREASLSAHHFLRAFKEAFRETPHAYLTWKRIERAKQLLIQSEIPITQVCVDIGFQSASSFSSLFRRHTGLSPRAFRQQAPNRAL